LPETKLPGDEGLGSFDFNASLMPNPPGIAACPLEDVLEDGGTTLAFSAAFSRDPVSGEVFMTLAGNNLDGGYFDGQVLQTRAHQAPRDLARCFRPEIPDGGPDGGPHPGCPSAVQVREQLTIALLSRSQDDLLQGECPPEPLDGGLPPPNRRTDAGFDAIRACGELVDELLPACNQDCSYCMLRYRVEGIRR
jgi:hypothetical protein